jgi:lantibiotic modifying enzyme
LNRWTPILPPDSLAASRAHEAIAEFSRAISQGDYPPLIAKKFKHRNYEEPILYGYLALAYDTAEWRELTADHLNTAIESAPSLRNSLALFGGLCGLGWVVEHFAREWEEDDDPIGDIDGYVLQVLERTPWSGSYDLISGLVGVGVYFLERMPRDSAVRGLRLVLDRLEALAERTSVGVTWHTGPELLGEFQREMTPAGQYNLGVAHGVPGVIHFLNELAAAGIETHRATHLLGGAMDWLIAQQHPPERMSRFGYWVASTDSGDSRLTWCYGDLGILAVVWQAARRTGRPDWRCLANELLDHCLAWPPDQSGIADAALCHGAAGAAHIFNRIYQETGDSRCLAASRAWLDCVLNMRRAGEGVGGFLARAVVEPEKIPVWDPNPAFLDGAIGVALTLLAAVSPCEPNWDRLLLLSGRSFN